MTLKPTKGALADFIRDVKANASRWINELPNGGKFAWQIGYGVCRAVWVGVCSDWGAKAGGLGGAVAPELVKRRAVAEVVRGEL